MGALYDSLIQTAAIGGWLLVLAMVASALVLAAGTLVCLVADRRPGRGKARVWFGLFALTAEMLFGGDWLLGLAGQTWRFGARVALLVLTAGTGGVAVYQAARRGAVLLEGRNRARQRYCDLAVILSVLAVPVVFASGVWWLAHYPSQEQETVWEGQQVVMVHYLMFDDSRDVYRYHGPLVRGRQALIREADSGEEAGELFLLYQEDFLQAARQALAQGSADGVELPWGVKDITLWDNAQGRCVEFYMGGAGFGPSTAYWGVIYTTGAGPVGFQGDVQDYVWDGEGWSWQETGGDNGSYVLPLTPHWYAYEMHF